MTNGRALYAQFICAFLFGTRIDTGKPRDVGTFKGWTPSQLQTVVDVARRQLDAQKASLDRTIARSQFLFTTLLALAAVGAKVAADIWVSPPTGFTIASRVVLIVSVLLLGGALLGASAVIAVRKNYEDITATVLSEWKKFDLARLAREYTECLDPGEMTTNAQLTVFGKAVRLTLFGSVTLGIAFVLLHIS